MKRTLAKAWTSVLSMSLLHAVALSKLLPWFEPTKVISMKTLPHAVNMCKTLVTTQLKITRTKITSTKRSFDN